MAVTSNLYPPIIDTYMPAFLVAKSVSTTSVTKTYTVLSYANQEAYDANVNQYIINSPIDGVEELWAEYEEKLADIAAQYPDKTDPIRIELERQLKVTYDALLVQLISGSSNKDKTEEAFFAERPEPVEITKTATFDTAYTTDPNFICKVYFSLSPYNSLSEIANAQITVRSQLTNRTVLHKSKYPSEIMLQNIKTDTSRKTDDKYYIEIKPEDLEGCNFTIDQYYKIQIRFTSINAEDPGISLTDPDAVQAIDSWLSRNLKYFSEWSTVCLIRGISVPSITIKDFNEEMATEIYDTIINTQVIGYISFTDENETETLKSYRVRSYDSNDNLLTDSGDILSNQFTDINNFNYAIKYWFRANNEYYFTVTYTTQNLYTETHRYDFVVSPSGLPDLNIQVTAYQDEENGRIGMRITRSRAKGRYTGDIVIRRASNKDNFAIWEDMYVATYDHAPFIDLTWYDYTVECGILYLYGIQGVDTSCGRTPMVTFNHPVMINFEDIFLTSGDKQLKIKFNPSLTSFKRTLSETKIDTIGSQYPFIKRNGAIDYVQFPLGGLISSAMDEDGLFITKEEIFGNYLDNYKEYNEEHDIVSYQDVIWEKFFRQKVEKFLYADDVKLFRSPTEGNFLIRLMDVNFQPNQTLGRRLWSFTSTAYEIDDCTLENYELYNIFSRTNGGTIVSGGGDEPSTLAPIQRIVFINNENEFPTVGRTGVLYVYNKQFYIWNEDLFDYVAISVPIWNEEMPDLSGLTGGSRRLYTNGTDLFVWNDNSGEYDIISVPTMEG